MTAPIRIPKAYEEIIDFLAAGTSPDSIIAFQPSENVKKRVAELLYREKTELDHYMQLEHLMRLAKARARQYSTNELES